MSLRGSKINVYDGIHFENNKVAYGAALKVCDGSLIFFAQQHTFSSSITLPHWAVQCLFNKLVKTPPCPAFFQPALHESI